MSLGEVTDIVRVGIDLDTHSGQRWSEMGRDNDLLFHTYVDVTSIQDSSHPEYMQLPILNRAERIITYQGTTNREVSLMFRFAVDGGVEGASADAILSSVVEPAQWLDSLKMSFRDDSGVIHAPPPVYLVVGSLFYMRAVVSACAITWKAPWFYKQRLAGDALPMHAEAMVTFLSVSKSPDGMPSAYLSTSAELPE